VTALVGDILGALDAAFASIDERHQQERQELTEREERYAVRSTLRSLEERQRRERRRFRMGELRFGFAVLARTYRDRLAAELDAPSAAGTDEEPGERLRALAAIQQAAEALERNPAERLLLERLFVHLAPLR
jgi:hypothetical protein